MTGKNKKKMRRKYDALFKDDVLKIVATGRSVSDVAQALVWARILLTAGLHFQSKRIQLRISF
jgi:hypothetical protein